MICSVWMMFLISVYNHPLVKTFRIFASMLTDVSEKAVKAIKKSISLSKIMNYISLKILTNSSTSLDRMKMGQFRNS